MKIRKNKNTITTKIKRSELLSKLRCLGGSSWCSEENFYTDLALEKVNTAIADLLSYQNLYGFYPEPDYEVKLTKRQMDLMFVFYSYINKGKFNDAYHELWDSIEKSWETYSEDDYLAYDELVAIYGLLFTFKLAVELAELKTSYQNIKEELENAKLRLNILECEEAEEQRALAKLFEERFDTESNLFFGDYEHRIIKDLLSGTLKINELCFAERTGNKSFYIYALRFARDSKNNEEYKQVLELLQSDINHLSEERLKENLVSVYDIYKEDLNILEDNADIVQIDVEKEFNQMVEDYNQSPENISINPLEIEPVDELIKQNETSEMEKAMMLIQEIKQDLQKALTNNTIAKEQLINDKSTSSANCKLSKICKSIIDDILMLDFWKQSSVEFLQIIFLAITHTDTQHRTFADVIELLRTATFDKNGHIDKDCDLAKLLINFRNLYSQGSKEYEQCEAILNIPKATFKSIKQIMIDKLNLYKDEVIE